MGWGNAYFNWVLLSRSNTWFLKNLAQKQMNDSQRSQSEVQLLVLVEQVEVTKYVGAILTQCNIWYEFD